MATHRQGVLGGFKGRIGNIVGSSWNGQNVMRIRPASVSNPRTPAQQNIRSRFALMGRLLSTQRRLVNIGFKAYVEGGTAFNAAMKYNLANAVAGEYPDLSLDFSQLRLSRGTLPVLTGLQAVVSSSLSFDLTWTDNSSMSQAGPDDLLMIGVYDPETASGYNLMGAFKRSDASGSVTLPDNWANRQIELFVFVVSPLGMGQLYSKESISESTYLGTLQLTD